MNHGEPRQTSTRPHIVGSPGERLAWIDTLRVLAVLLVVLEHAIIVPGSLVPNYVWALNGAFLPFRIPALMFLSGMLLQRSLAKSRRAYIRGKVDRIAWPLTVWTTIFILADRSTGGSSTGWWQQYFHAPGPLFYLQYLLLFYAVALFVPDRVRGWLIVPSLLASALLSSNDEAERLFFLFAFFLAGDVFMRHVDRLAPIISSVWVVVAAAIASAATALTALLAVPVRYNAVFAPGTMAGIIVAIALCRRGVPKAIGRTLGPYGKHTIVYYVASWPVQLLVFTALLDAGMEHPLVLVGTLVVVGLGAGHLFVLAQERFRPVRYLFNLSPRSTAGRRGTG